jgi:hypothetical protein
MSTFHALIQACGLSLREAAEFLNAREDTIKSWSSGRRSTPDGALAELAGLAARIVKSAHEGLAEIDRHETAEIELGLACDDYEAQALGWPCVGAHRACLGLVAAWAIQAGHHVKIVPRGSTVATAAAADRHGPARNKKNAPPA